MTSRSHKSLLYIGLAHSQSGHPLDEFLCLFWIHGERSHGRSLVEQAENLKTAYECKEWVKKAMAIDEHIVKRVALDYLKE